MTLGCNAPAPVEMPKPRDLSLLTQDGARIVGTLYAPTRTRPAGLILVPARGGNRSDFVLFAEKAQQEGYLSLAIDRSDSGEPDGDPQPALNDIDAARLALLNAGADPENLAIVGARGGANLAIAYAAAHDDIQAAVLLSPIRTDSGISAEDAVRRYGRRPLLLMVSSDDALAYATCRSLREAAAGHCEIREYEGQASGTEIFDAAATSCGQALLWLTEIIGPDAARRNRQLGSTTPTPEK